MRRFILCVATKGGVGKSTVAQAFTGLARRAGRSVSAWDLDRGTGSLALVFRDRNPMIGAGTEDVTDPKSPGAWLNAVFSDADDVILDVPGGALDRLVGSLEGGAPSLVSEAREAGREFVVASVIGIKPDMSGAPRDSLRLFGTAVRHVVVKNLMWGAPESFIVYDGMRDENGQIAELFAGVTYDDGSPLEGGQSKADILLAGGVEVLFPRFGDSETDAILAMRRLSYVDGVNEVGLLGRKRTANIRYWLGSVEAALASSWLSPAGQVAMTAPKRQKAVVA